jgi:hypothetical protein
MISVIQSRKKMSIQKIKTFFIVFIILLIFSIVLSPWTPIASAGNAGTVFPYPSTFEERKAQYMEDVVHGLYGQHYNCHRNLLWAYLEKENPTQLDKDKIHLILRSMVHRYAETYRIEPELMESTGCVSVMRDGTVGFFLSVSLDNLLAVRILDQYAHLAGERIRQDDLDFLEERWKEEMLDKGLFVITANGNSQLQSMPGIFLYGDKIVAVFS